MKKIILVLSILAVLFTVSCKDKGTDPEPVTIVKYKGIYTAVIPEADPLALFIPKKIAVTTDGKITIYKEDGSVDDTYSNNMTVTKESDTKYKVVVKLQGGITATMTLEFSGSAGNYSFIMDIAIKSSDTESAIGPYTYNKAS